MWSRRTLLKAGSAAVAVGAVAGGVAYQRYRRTGGLVSERITGEWPEVGVSSWLLPDLDGALMQVPDRPHDKEELGESGRGGGITRVRQFTVSTSSRRLRGDRHGSAPAAGVKRYVGVGDSTTFGWGVPDDRTWPAQLEAALGAGGHRAEVLNAGVPGQALENMKAWLERAAPQLGLSGVFFTRRLPPMPNPYAEYASAVRAAQRALPGVRIMVLLPPVSQFDPHGCDVWDDEVAGLRAQLPDVPVFDLTPGVRAAQGKRGARMVVEGRTWHMVRGEADERLVSGAAAPHGLPREFYDRFERDPTVREALFFDDGHCDEEGLAVTVPLIVEQMRGAGWLA